MIKLSMETLRKGWVYLSILAVRVEPLVPGQEIKVHVILYFRI